jgi:VanZ family protein
MNTRELTVHHWRKAFIFWFILLAVATHLPQATPSNNPVFESPDKLLHFVCFGMLAFLFSQTRWITSPSTCWAIVALWAIVDEATQHMLPINRAFSLADLVAGELGIAAFMLWFGALSQETTRHIRETVNEILSSGKNWFLIGFIAFGVGLVVLAALWFSFKVFTGEPHTPLAFFVSCLVASTCILWFIVSKGALMQEVWRITKNMVLPLSLTIVFAAMAGAFISFTTFDPWVAAMAILVVGSRIAWNRAT